MNKEEMQKAISPEKIEKDLFHAGAVSTISTKDSTKPFETAIAHRSFNNGRWIVVEEYDNVEDAKTGHSKWKKDMFIDEHLPDELTDVSTSPISIEQGLSGKTHKRGNK